MLDQKVTKLENVVVEEVSFVDRPANQRKFLLVKRESGAVMPQGTELAEEGAELVEKHQAAQVETAADAENGVDDAAAQAPETPASDSADSEDVKKRELVAAIEAAVGVAGMDKLEKALSALLSEEAAQPSTESQVKPENVVKSDATTVPSEPSAELVKLAKAVDALTALVQSQQAQIEAYRSATRPASRVATVGEHTGNTGQTIVWPYDFNDVAEDVF